MKALNLKDICVTTSTIDTIQQKILSQETKFEEKLNKVSESVDVQISRAFEEYNNSFRSISIVTGAHPKRYHKNRFIQWILIKLFGYELEYKTILTRVLVYDPEDDITSSTKDPVLAFDYNE